MAFQSGQNYQRKIMRKLCILSFSISIISCSNMFYSHSQNSFSLSISIISCSCFITIRKIHCHSRFATVYYHSQNQSLFSFAKPGSQTRTLVMAFQSGQNYQRKIMRKLCILSFSISIISCSNMFYSHSQNSFSLSISIISCSCFITIRKIHCHSRFATVYYHSQNQSLFSFAKPGSQTPNLVCNSQTYFVHNHTQNAHTSYPRN